MNYELRKKSAKFIFCSFLFLFLFGSFNICLAGWWGSGSNAQDYLERVGEEGFKTSGPPQGGELQRLIFKIINYVLGFLGVIFMALIIYGGFMWMTALGNEQKVTQAKTIMANAAIGLAIVLVSYAITLFVFKVFVG